MLKQFLLIASIAAAFCAGITLARAQDSSAKAKAEADPSVQENAAAKADANFEVLTRGPIHEAYATQYQVNAAAGATVDREPPPAIDEIPPPAKPRGEGIVWIPGYWAWDAPASDFLWVSGVFRNAPPNHRWTPGYWAKTAAGYQWMSGFWAAAATTSLNYYSPPPQSLERGPSSPAPGADYFWAPGAYVPQNEKYAWQPGYWVPYQANYVWTPARNIATAGGYIHLPGYWDYRFDQRGALFAPVRLNAAADATTNLQFSPSTLLPFANLQFHLFSQAKSNTFLFGDYYGETYASQGIRPWYSYQYVKGISDPLFGYYNWAYGRAGTNYTTLLAGWNQYYTTHAAVRPAVSLAAQLDLAKTTTEVKNLTSLLGVPLLSADSAAPQGFVSLSASEQAAIKTSLQDLRLLADNRLKLETSANGAAHVSAAAGTALQVAATPLTLPRAVVPAVASVPAAPAQLVRGVGNAANSAGQAAGGVVRGTTGALPKVVPGVLPGVLPGGTAPQGGLVPNLLPPPPPSGGVLPGVLPGRDDGEGGGLLPIP